MAKVEQQTMYILMVDEDELDYIFRAVQDKDDDGIADLQIIAHNLVDAISEARVNG